MRVIIVGLGNFGSSLGIRLTASGHEVIGIDNSMQKVEQVKDKITHAICMDCTDANAIGTLPIKDTDLVIIAIGEDIESSLMATAIMKQFKARKIFSRSINTLQKTVIEAIGVDEILSPEEDSAERLSKRLNIKGIIDSFVISKEYAIIETEVPVRYVGKTVEQSKFREKYNVNIITILRYQAADKQNRQVLGVVHPSTTFASKDILVLFANNKDIEKLLKNA